MTLDELAAALLEVRRYVRSDPVYVRKEVERLEDAIREVSGHELPRLWADRLEINLLAGRHRLGAFNEAGECVTLLNPEILEGYLYNAAQEIRWHAARLRKEGE